MNKKNLNELYNRIDDVKNLLDDGYDIAQALGEDCEADENDWAKMLRFTDRLYNFKYRMILFDDIYTVIERMESERDRSIVQENFQYHIEQFEAEIDLFIKISRTWKMEDYRCRNFQRRMEDLFLELRELVRD